jgi:hypothetical protein
MTFSTGGIGIHVGLKRWVHGVRSLTAVPFHFSSHDFLPDPVVGGGNGVVVGLSGWSTVEEMGWQQGFLGRARGRRCGG